MDPRFRGDDDPSGWIPAFVRMTKPVDGSPLRGDDDPIRSISLSRDDDARLQRACRKAVAQQRFVDKAREKFVRDVNGI
jgi:hypothetical protein